MITTWTEFAASIRAHESGDEVEEACKAEMVEALDKGIGTDRECPTHFTGSAFVFSSAGVLLHRHLKLNRWMQPGGHVDSGELPAQAALREIEEETGIPATFVGDGIIAHLDTHDANGHRHLDVRYLFRAEPVTPNPREGESQDVRWVAMYDLKSIVDENLSRVLSRLEALSF